MKLSTRNIGRSSPAARGRSPLSQPGATPPSQPMNATQIRPGSRPAGPVGRNVRSCRVKWPRTVFFATVCMY